MIHVGYKLTFQQTDQVTKWIYLSKFTLFFLAQHVVVSWNFYSKSMFATERYGEMECDGIPIRVGVCVCTPNAI